MTTLFTIKKGSANTIAKLLWEKRGNALKHEAVCSTGTIDSVKNGTYVFERVVSVDSAYAEIQDTLGTQFLKFKEVISGAPLYLFGQSPGSFGRPVYPDGVGVPKYVFDEFRMAVVTSKLPQQLRVKQGWAIFSGKAVRGSGWSLPKLGVAGFEGYEKPPVPVRKPVPSAAAAPAPAVPSRVAAFPAAKPVLSKPETPAQAPRKTSVAGSSTHPAVRQSNTHYHNTTTRADDDDLLDFMFMSSYPGIAPLYRPSSMYAWMLWSEAQDRNSARLLSQEDSLTCSGSIPGFPDAVREYSTPIAGGRHVELFDSFGNTVATFNVTQRYDGNWTLRAENGCSYNVDTSQATPALFFDNDGVSVPLVGPDSIYNVTNMDGLLGESLLPGNASDYDSTSDVIAAAAQAGMVADTSSGLDSVTSPAYEASTAY